MWYHRFCSVAVVAVITCPAALAQAGRASAAAKPADETARAIAVVEARLDSGLAAHDRPMLDRLVTQSFIWVHASDGRVEARESWLTEAARGMALSRQREVRSVFDRTLVVYGGNTAVRTARIRLRSADSTHETWMRQVVVFMREADGVWRIASGQGTLMYEGPPVDAALYARYAGTYVITPGRSLTLVWDGNALQGTLPNGSDEQTQDDTSNAGSHESAPIRTMKCREGEHSSGAFDC
jgi:ketosteroid isomerase-like protein